MDPLLSPESARVLRLLIMSCGSARCIQAMKLLESLKEPVELSAIGLDESGNWRMSVFQRLLWYANDYGVKAFTVEDVVRYFGGTLHIDIMDRIADHAGLGQYLGRDVGLLTHALLPLKGNTYMNEGHVVTFKGSIELNPEEIAARFYHLGGIINIPVSQRVIDDVLREQYASESFVRALQKLDGRTIRPPEEYLKGLACTAEKAST